ncbi:MAG: hypothetical protein ABIV21_02265 [Pyrinomonadaceae bacterium]
MKTIFRYVNVGLLFAAIATLGAVASFAQAPCDDAAGMAALDAKFRDNYAKGIPERKMAVEAGKQYIEKFGECPASKDFVDYLKSYLPGMEKKIKDQEEAAATGALLKQFDDNLKTKNWNEVYAAGKQILAQKPDEYRDAELVLGSIGLDETAKSPKVTTWNEDTLKYAKMAIADLEANKTFKTYGVGAFKYKNKEDALGWMNYTIGYIYFFDKNDKKQGLSYLYKATQLSSETKTNPVVYQSIGAYYFDEVRKLAGEVDVLAKGQDPKDTEEVAKQKVDAIKAKVAMVNGTSEAAIDAYARAYDLAKKNPKTQKPYTDSLYKTLQDLYNVRFGKMDGFDAFIARTVTKPMPNPLEPVKPIDDVAPASATSTTITAAPAKTAEVTKPAPVETAKPATTTARTRTGARTGTVAKRPLKRKAN